MQAVVLTIIGMSAVFLFLCLVMWTLTAVLWFVRRGAVQDTANEKTAALIGIALSRGIK